MPKLYISHTVIIIGFERPFYTTNEQSGVAHNVVSLIKQDNRTTERSFLINVRAVDASPPGSGVATLDDDYAVTSMPGQRDILLQFNSFQDSLPIPFEVFDDSVVEGPEAFQLQSSRRIGSPVFTSPDELEATVFSSAFVQMLDSGSKCTNNNYYFCSIGILRFREYICIYSIHAEEQYNHRWYTQASHGRNTRTV